MSNSPFDILLDKTSILEIAANGTVVGTLSTIDFDEGDSFRYELLDDADGRFGLSESGNQIVVKDNSKFDYKTAFFHTIKVKVTDSSNLTFEKNIDIALIDAKRNLVGRWKLDETTGTFDNSSFVNTGNDGTTQGSLNFGKDGILDKSVGFGNGSINIGKNLLSYAGRSSNDKFSITAWVKPSDYDFNSILSVDNRGEGGSTGFVFALNFSSLMFLFYRDGRDTRTSFLLPSSFRPNQWYHVAVTISGTAGGIDDVMTFYVNGEEIGSQKFNLIADPSESIKDYLIGAEDPGSGNGSTPYHPFKGQIDEVRVYNTALSRDEIASVIQESNFAPTDIKIGGNVLYLDQNSDKAFLETKLTAQDSFLDKGKHTYTLIDDVGGLFGINGDVLFAKDAAGLLDYDTNLSPTVKIRATDPDGNVFDKEFTIQVIPKDQDETNPGLIVYYKLDERGNNTSELQAINSSGESVSQPAKYVGPWNPLTLIKNNGPTRSVEGIYGTSAKFQQGTSINTEISDAQLKYSNQFTVMGWIKPQEFKSDRQFVFSQEDASIFGYEGTGIYSGWDVDGKGFGFGLQGKNLMIRSYKSGDRQESIALPDSVFINQWTHLAISYSNQTASFYVNGTFLGTRSLNLDYEQEPNPAGKYANGPLDYLIGANTLNSQESNVFNGQIDEVRFYNQALSKDQLIGIIEKYNSGPQDITINSNVIIDDAANGTVVGQLDSVGISLDKGKYTYELLDDAGGKFALSGDQIIVKDKSLLSYLDKTVETIKVKTTNTRNQTTEKEITLQLIESEPEAGLKAYYKLDESDNLTTKQTALDSSGNNKNGFYSEPK